MLYITCTECGASFQHEIDRDAHTGAVCAECGEWFDLNLDTLLAVESVLIEERREEVCDRLAVLRELVGAEDDLSVLTAVLAQLDEVDRKLRLEA